MFLDISKREHNLIEVMERTLGETPKYVVNRNHTWSISKQEAFIEYIMMEYPISDIIMWRQPSDPNRQCYLMHGEKKINAVLNFLNDQITYYGKKYSELRQSQKDVFDNAIMRINVIEVEDEDSGKHAVDLWKRFL